MSNLTLPAFPPQNPEERAQMLRFVRETPFVYGQWKALKSLYKQAELGFANGHKEPEILAAFLARLDAQSLADLPANAAASRHFPTMKGDFVGVTFNSQTVFAFGSQRVVTFSRADAQNAAPHHEWELPREVHRPSSLVRAGEQRLIVRSSDRLLSLLAHIGAPDVFEPQIVFQTHPTTLEACGNHLVQTVGSFLCVYEMPTQSGPLHEIGRLEIAGLSHRLLATNGRYVAVCARNENLVSVVDLIEPRAPRHVGDVAVQYPNGLEWIPGTDFLICAGHSKIQISQASPSNLKKVSNWNNRNGHSITVNEKWCYVSSYYYGQNVWVDISDPYHPVERAREQNTSYGQRARTLIDATIWSADGSKLDVLDVSDPAKPRKVGARISRDTMAYMKRRGRRFLRALAEANAPEFWPIAQTILESKTGRELDLNYEWLAADLLFGRGHNWRHARSNHGRVERRFLEFARRNREERAPKQWDAHLDWVFEAAKSEQSPRFLIETARRVLRHNGRETPPLSGAQLERLLRSESPAVRVEAARDAIQVVPTLNARALAGLLWILKSKGRAQVLAQVKAGAALATELATVLGAQTTARSGLSRRGREVALLLAARFDLSNKNFSASGARALIPLLLQSGEAPIRGVGLGFARRLAPLEALQSLENFEQIPEIHREIWLLALEESAASGKFGVDELQNFVRDEAEWIRMASWQLAAHSKTSNDVFRQVWLSLFRGVQTQWSYEARRYELRIPEALQSAAKSPFALEILSRQSFYAYEMPRFPGGDTQVSPELFAAILVAAPAEQITEVLLAQSGEQHEARAEIVAQRLQNLPLFATKFWNAVLAALEDPQLPEKSRDSLRVRTLQNARIAATFGENLGRLSPSTLLFLLGYASDEQWNSWRARILGGLENDAQNAAFWEASKNMAWSEILGARLNETAFAARFAALRIEVEGFDQEAHDPLLRGWLQAHEAELDNGALSKFAVHPLPRTRKWALEKLLARGLNLAFALRLHESGLRDAQNAAQNWATSQTQNLVGVALGFCDSPRLFTRQFGREFVQNRLEKLIEAGFLAAIQENTNAEMQAFVAGLLNEREALASADFDRAVLRRKNRARRAKTLVQTRLEQKPLQNARVLLELARGKTPRDREFALQQLAKLAAEKEIGGVEIGGVGAI